MQLINAAKEAAAAVVVPTATLVPTLTSSASIMGTIMTGSVIVMAAQK